MPFQVEPNSVSSATERPLSFRYQMNAGSDVNVFRLKIEVLISTVVVATYYEDAFDVSGTAPNIFVRWDFDVQRIMNRQLPPKSTGRTLIFPNNLNGGYSNSTRSYDPSYVVRVTPLTVVNGLITPAAASESASSKAVNAIWQDEEGENYLDRFFVDASNRYPLIDRTEIDLCLDEIFQLVYYNTGAVGQNTSWTVTKYLKAGGTATDTITVSRVGGYNTIGVGTKDLSIDDTIEYYEISKANYQTIRINVKGACCKVDSLRLCWMNQRGGYDAYRFNYRKIRKTDVSSNTERRGLRWRNELGTKHTQGQKGLIKTGVEKFEYYEIQSNGDLHEEDLNWIEWLFSSSEVYAEIDGVNYLVPVIVGNDDDIIIDDSDRVNLFIQAKVTIATPRLTHSN